MIYFEGILTQRIKVTSTLMINVEEDEYYNLKSKILTLQIPFWNIENSIQIQVSDILSKVEMKIYWNIGLLQQKWKYESNTILSPIEAWV